MRKVLEGSIKAGERVTMTAERLLSANVPIVEIPRHVQELSEAARFPRATGTPNLFEGAVRSWQRKLSVLGQGASREHGEYTIQTATKQLVTDLRKAKPDQVDKIVDRWILEKARYQARVVARHESVEAFRDVAIEQARSQPYVVGVRWALSPAHKIVDICDLHANADQYGLGPGGYPADQVPARHTSCLCATSPLLDPLYFKREIAKAKGEAEPEKPWLTGVKESPEQWLRKQSVDAQKAIMGPTRTKLVAQGRKVLDKGASNFRPVYRLLNKPKPSIDHGPRIDASGIIAADRANMAQPFPDLRSAG